MSEWLALALAMAGACLVVVAVVLVRHRKADEDEDTSETPDVIEYITMMIGVVYAIVLGLAIAGVWESRSAAQDDVQTEAQSLYEVSSRAEVFPADYRAVVDKDVDAYVSFVVDTEWHYMRTEGGISPDGTALLGRLRTDVASRAPQNDIEAQAYQAMMDKIAVADEARNSRGGNVGPTMPGVVWFGLGIGAVVTIGMMFALQIRRTRRELVLAGTFSALIGFLLFLIWDFDDPFGRGMSVTTEPFLNLFPFLGG
ncbi:MULTISPECIES: DUF4239 domain-containing protein [Kitasatospora]|uniref:DUF4239 domain-containing protein n=1 Tax=Kitasatospora setae (strain ATCC 33774 / DSM 43861 / JCM 3304 / KCC A-0304 / NBRC 14216 / KM-6054) TaxID=452652 RepID=E4N4K0_KITSK|nr:MULTISPECIES: DUF4239 domain-containing protein [Kitasatospora]BAJ26131.1 hypothetical protein KSE_02840 [Kitasatospora setae KM-6054]